MVFFVCDTCNETLKKNQVDKHCYRCSCPSVTCVDCSVTFYGNDYAAHVTCISEAEKYEKGLFKPKTKQSPQDMWMDSIKAAIDSASSAPLSIRSSLEKLADYDNIPRNRKKFENFVKNSLRLYASNTVEELWNWIQSKSSFVSSDTPAADSSSVSASVKETVVGTKRVADEAMSNVKVDSIEHKSKKSKSDHDSSDMNNNSSKESEVEKTNKDKKDKKDKKEKKDKKDKKNKKDKKSD